MFPRLLNLLYVLLIGLAFTGIELMIGGTRLVFSLPAYGVLALAGVLSLGDLRRAKPSPDGWCLGTAAVFFGYVLARALASPVAYLAWADEFLVLGCLVLYLLTACYLTDPGRRLWVLWVLLALAAVNVLVGLRQFTREDSFMLFGFVRTPQYLGRASGLYVCPDHLAGFLEVVGCLGLAAAFWGRMRVWVRLLTGYVAVLCFVGLLLTGSRGGVLSAGAGLLTLGLLGLGRMRVQSPATFVRSVQVLAAAAVLGVLGVWLVVLPSSATLQGRVHAAFDLGRDDRPMLWGAAVREFEAAPLFGTGAGTYLYYGREFRDPHFQRDPVRTHNDYLELLAEYGAAGGAGLLLFLGAHLWRGAQGYRALSLRTEHPDLPGRGRGSNAAAWNLGALAAAACFLVHSAVDFNLHIPANALLFAFLFGVLANPGRSLDPLGSPVARRRGIDLLPRLALPALGVWLALAGLPKLPGEYDAEEARVALRDGHPAAALFFATRGLERERANPDLYGYLGQVQQIFAGNGPDTPVARSFRLAAVEAYRAGLRLAPMDVNLLVPAGELLTRLGDFDAADDVFARARRWDPNSGYVDTYYGFYLQSRGRPAEAEAAYRRAGVLYPSAAATENLRELLRVRAANAADQ